MVPSITAIHPDPETANQLQTLTLGDALFLNALIFMSNIMWHRLSESEFLNAGPPSFML